MPHHANLMIHLCYIGLIDTKSVYPIPFAIIFNALLVEEVPKVLSDGKFGTVDRYDPWLMSIAPSVR
jgi:hypothetical protein